jgi:hypothetical protein
MLAQRAAIPHRGGAGTAWANYCAASGSRCAVRELPEADGTPKIVVMGGLLAFRDSRGVVGVIDQYCPRGANL